MARTAILSVRVVSDTKQAQRGAQETAAAWEKFEKRLDKASVYAGAAGAGLVALGKKSVDAASRLEQSSGAVEAVFKKDAATITKFAETAWENIGVSQSEMQEMATVLGSQLKNLGIPMEDVAGKTIDLAKLGNDLAATYGGTTSDAVSALSALLRGERDPIEKYGVTINEAAVKAEALALGLAETAQDADKVSAAQARAEVAQRKYNAAVEKYGADSDQALTASATLTSANSALEKAVAGTTIELTAQQKAQATLSLLGKQTADAQGQAAREYDSVESATQRANAAWQNTIATLGTALLPTVAQLAEHLADAAQWVSENEQLVRNLAAGVGIAAASILGLNAGIKVFTAGAAVVRGFTAAGSAAVSTIGRFVGGMRSAQVAGSAFSGVAGTIGGKVAALGKVLVSGAVAAGKWAVQTAVLTAKLVAQKTAQLAIAAASKAAAAAQAIWNAILNANPVMLIITLIVAAIALLIMNWETVQQVAATVWEAITAAATWFWENVLVPIGEFIGTVFTVYWTVYSTAALIAWNLIKTAAVWFWNNVLVPIGEFIAGVFVASWTALRIAATAVWSAIQTAGATLWNWLKSVGSWISGTFRAAWDGLKTAGSAALNALVTPVKTLIDWLKSAVDWVGSLFSSAGDFLGDIFGFSAAVTVEGAPAAAALGSPPPGVAAVGRHPAGSIVQQHIEVTVNAPNYVGDRQAFARTVRDALRSITIHDQRIARV